MASSMADSTSSTPSEMLAPWVPELLSALGDRARSIALSQSRWCRKYATNVAASCRSSCRRSPRKAVARAGSTPPSQSDSQCCPWSLSRSSELPTKSARSVRKAWLPPFPKVDTMVSCAVGERARRRRGCACFNKHNRLVKLCWPRITAMPGRAQR